MSRSRNDPRKAKLRRERIRREKHVQNAGEPAMPYLEHPFASERALAQIHALMGEQVFDSIEEANARISEFTEGGRLAERAAAWKRDDPKWQAQELAYDALETGDPAEALRLVREALRLDPDCTDAQRLMVAMVPAGREDRLQMMREVVAKAEANFGESYFAETMGRFWGAVETRPYMRAMQHLGELLAETGREAEAVEVFERMLKLNPGDNQGMRYHLLGLYLAMGRAEDAARVMSGYPGEEEHMATFAWARVLERWLSGDLAEAGAALARARTVNPFAEKYLSGRRELPREAPDYFRRGDESEAQTCAVELALAWTRHPGAREWLAAQRRPAARD